ncbi:hypothetical protein PPL_00457 [Heterostelium album PN500]|uniref:Nudix hydrolase domain-containing protein n=1 Tax=Heterostelium pallidum (strain ATCC 26659 / Pp 5 / PN500) TaxID=670386 RepID=D3AWI3_HETP5|nr:hypothetical protein PPL_00457 [Heterostelium album PN500]EFA86656.1 hypothetical protein PPL_00457 [Heterostelium album PN500]|eukprot:XP_020438761.1 hypothetical protein PPL_00457 [Heterostelium album PN500]
MKFLVLVTVLLCILNSAIADPKCYRCLGEGDVCNPSSSICPYGTICANISDTNRCVALPTLGGNCSVTEACLDGYKCDDGTSICVAKDYLGYGEKCTSDSQCTNELKCVNGGLCLNEKYPKCSKRGGCKPGETCIEGNCTTPLADGAVCKEDDDCIYTRSCLKNRCTVPLTVPEGGDCEDTVDCDVSKGLRCVKGSCMQFVSGTNCTVQNDQWQCPDMSICTCDSPSNFTGGCQDIIDFSSITQSKFNSYYECVSKSGCPYVDNIIKESCLSKCSNPVDVESNIDRLCNSGNIVKGTFLFTVLIVLSSLLFSMYQSNSYSPQAGCIPLRIKKKYIDGGNGGALGDKGEQPHDRLVLLDIQVMLVTSGSGETWVFPKGSIKKNETKKKAAKRETFEEAGLKGKIVKSIEPLEVADHHKECNLTYYVLYVKKKKKEWDESDKRLRNWFSLNTVLKERLPMKPHIEQAIIATQRAISIYQNNFGKDPIPKDNFKLKKKELEMALFKK